MNQALSAGHACLYGLAHAVIVALGCSAGLGFVHIGHENSFVYDIADLYKAETTIPIAFETAAQQPDDLPAMVRRRLRDTFLQQHILERMVRDIKWLLSGSEENSPQGEDTVLLWNNQREALRNGVSYGKKQGDQA